jgi:hypothetical protein
VNRSGFDQKIAVAEHDELLKEAAEMRRIPKAPERLRWVIVRWGLVLLAMAALAALWIATKP